MNFSWAIALYQVLIILLVLLFFVGLYRFVNRIIQHTKNTKITLKRLEEKIDKLTEELNKNNDELKK